MHEKCLLSSRPISLAVMPTSYRENKVLPLITFVHDTHNLWINSVDGLIHTGQAIAVLEDSNISGYLCVISLPHICVLDVKSL